MLGIFCGPGGIPLVLCSAALVIYLADLNSHVDDMTPMNSEHNNKGHDMLGFALLIYSMLKSLDHLILPILGQSNFKTINFRSV